MTLVVFDLLNKVSHLPLGGLQVQTPSVRVELPAEIEEDLREPESDSVQRTPPLIDVNEAVAESCVDSVTHFIATSDVNGPHD